MSNIAETGGAFRNLSCDLGCTPLPSPLTLARMVAGYETQIEHKPPARGLCDICVKSTLTLFPSIDGDKANETRTDKP